MCTKSTSKSTARRPVKITPMNQTEFCRIHGLVSFIEDMEGVCVEFDDSSVSWFTREELDDIKKEAYESTFDFGEALGYLKQGLMITRKPWMGKLVVVKQVPATIGKDVIPHMTSLPESVKSYLLISDNASISYMNQCLVIDTEGHATSWTPTISDIFAEDWVVVFPAV